MLTGKENGMWISSLCSKKVKDLGFDILEISGGGLAEMPDEKAIVLKEEAKTVWNYAHRLHRSAG